jgi:phosphoglycerol transferase
MKIAILDAFPNLSHSAEREFICRSVFVLSKLGHQAAGVITSDDITRFEPDFVIITHEFVPKLTDHFTVGLLWGPTQFYKNDADRIRAIRSWDLVVPINTNTRRFAKDIHFPERHLSAVSDLNFYPSAPIIDLPTPDVSRLSLAYVGSHWDGLRHDKLLRALAEVLELNVYGPPNAWKHMPDQYRGPIPFDGESVIGTLNRHGAVLAVHNAAHADENTPSMRVFEGCAAKCLVFTDPMTPLIDVFNDSLKYVELYRSPRAIARTVKHTIERYRNAPSLFFETVERANAIFRSEVSLERLLSDLVKDVEQRRACLRASSMVNGTSAHEVTVIIRCGSRPLPMLQRAVASVQKQTFRRIGIIFARYAEIEGFDEWLEVLRRSERFLFLTDLRAGGGGVRSIAMWAGLRAVRTELFCMLDDDDELFSTHFAQLVEVLCKHPNVDIAYAGTVRQEEDGAFFNKHERFKGDLDQVIPERRTLQFFSDYNLDRLLRFDNFIQSNAWLAQRRVLTPEVLDDPEMEVSEDMYFYVLLASSCQFRFSGTASAIWNWRSRAQDNSMRAVSQQHWTEAGERIRRRLAQVKFPGGLLGYDVIGRGLGLRSTVPQEFSMDSRETVPEEDPATAPIGGQGPADRLALAVEVADIVAADADIGPINMARDGDVGEALRDKRRALRWAPRVASWAHIVVSRRARKYAVRELTPAPDRVAQAIDVRPHPGLTARTAILPAHELDLSFCIDFKAERLPPFIVHEYGLSGWEPWGRWTDGPRLYLRFRRPLPRVFTLEICGHASPSNDRKPITIVVGKSKARLVMSCVPDDYAYRVDIDNPDRADDIAFNIPNPQAPSELVPKESRDNRKLGIALIRFGVIDCDVD